MKPNMGSADKVVRILVAIVIAGLYFVNIISGTLAIVLLVLAGVFILTSFMSFCPLYLPFGISTRKKHNNMELQNEALIALIGAVAGLLGGMLGLGGAIIIIPAMVMLLGYSQQMAQGTALIMMVLPVGALAAFQYYQKGFVDVKAALILAIFFLWRLLRCKICNTNSTRYFKENFCRNACGYCD